MAQEKYKISKDGDKVKSKKDGLDIILEEPTGKMFKRRAYKWGGKKDETEIEWLVVSLDGVYVFIRDDDIIITKQNIRP